MRVYFRFILVIVKQFKYNTLYLKLLLKYSSTRVSLKEVLIYSVHPPVFLLLCIPNKLLLRECVTSFIDDLWQKCLSKMLSSFSVRSRHSFSPEGVCFRLRRNPSLLDDPVSVHASGLPANTPVTLGVKLFNEKEKLVFTLNNKIVDFMRISVETFLC